MDNKAAKPNEYPWLIPSLTVTDVKASQDFYTDAFGFSKGEVFDDESGVAVFGEMLYKNQRIIMLVKENGFGCNVPTPAHSNSDPATSLYVYCDDVDDFYEQAKKAKANIVNEPEDMFWGDRIVAIKDPDGHCWSFATRISNFEFNPEAATV